MLTSTLAAQCMIWETSPAAAELEEKPQAAVRFEGSFDASLAQELAATVQYEFSEPPEGSSRILVAGRLQKDLIGGFDGTCIDHATLRHLWDDKNVSPSQLHQSAKPSSLRMPRASGAGDWIHWIFAWERK